MAKHIVQCRFCKKKFDAEKDKEGIVWVQKSKGWYYHKDCYETWKNENLKKDDEWKERIYDFIAHDLKVSYDFFMCETQLINYVEKDKIGTYKGIYFALKYFYQVKNGDWNKGHGGLGIIPFIYEESTKYWIDQEEKKRGLLKGIENQIKERETARTVKIEKKEQKKKTKWNLEDF